MSQKNFVALGIVNRVAHLCIDSESNQMRALRALCRSVELDEKRARVDSADIDNLCSFNICKGCAIRFRLLGYEDFYRDRTGLVPVDREQMNLL